MLIFIDIDYNMNNVVVYPTNMTVFTTTDMYIVTLLYAVHLDSTCSCMNLLRVC
jgi:hypothetical protein